MSSQTATASAGAHAQRALARCDELGRISEEPGRLTRRFATPALKEANSTVLRWMEEAGMESGQDNVGNVVGRYAADAEDRPVLLLGSHLDSVRDAGRFDGPLGVVVALECVQRLHSEGRRLPFHVEVIGFADEEGVRYNTAYLGSKVVAGTFDPGYLDRADGDGITMREAIRSFGGDPERLADDARDPSQLLGYVEVHMEQGPVLEAEDLAVGVVSGIAGQSRVSVGFTGVAGHAGTVPMGLRRDALAGAAEWLGEVERRAQKDGDLVATVGVITAEPGASNVIPGRTHMTLDVRSADDPRRAQARDDLREAAETIAAKRGLERNWDVVQETSAVACSPELTSLLLEAVREAGRPERSMPSGAGHDAAALAAVTPVAMLFVRCAGGVSHNPAEDVAASDIEAAIDVLSIFLDRLAAAQ